MSSLAQDILKIPWVQSHERELPLFTMDLAAQGYVRSSQQLVGWRYSHILVCAEKGIERSYRDPMDDEAFVRFLARSTQDKIATFRRQSRDVAVHARDLLQQFRKMEKSTSRPRVRALLPRVRLVYADLAAVLGIMRPAGIYFERFPDKAEEKTVATIRQELGAIYPELEKSLYLLFQSLGNMWNVNSQLVSYLRADEIEACLRSGTRPSATTLRSRFARYVLFTTSRAVRILVKKDARHVTATVSRRLALPHSRTIAGRSAFGGRAKGRVRIVRNEEQAKKLRNGDVIVSPMTQVHFTPYLVRAAAIVTDEGGITSHAAIISRELKKPCVIGTKIATKVLNDGDEVEVDAEQGIVRILRRKL